ncbi:MAG: RNA polymerase subunit sigma [Cyanobacteria bacterium M5B4]|nr:sigma-70 family RNA polymerase sigma factor [Cyanobacteria bacterium KgW148]PLS68616.1 MAG: RNA polymerase subunit sigma [Cyanobacteria bacterium M5B4]
MTYSLSWSTVTEVPSTDLVCLCQQGMSPNKVHFARLMRRYQGHVDQLLYKLAPDWNDRADLAQEVWLRVYRHIKNLQEPEKFVGWVSRITTNLFYDELRKRKRHQAPISLDAPLRLGDGDLEWDLPSEQPNPVEHLSRQEFYEQLHRAIATLPRSFQETITLREVEGLSYEEIADITGVSIGTVKSRIARARMKLQTQLKSYLGS